MDIQYKAQVLIVNHNNDDAWVDVSPIYSEKGMAEARLKQMLSDLKPVRGARVVTRMVTDWGTLQQEV